MDHLPSPDQPSFTIRVPYLCTQPYDGLGFEEYPRRQGWDVMKLLDENLGAHSTDDLAPFVQNWLYFGVLTNVFTLVGLEFQQDEFVAPLSSAAGQQRVVKSAPLLRYISTWQAKTASLPTAECRAQGRAVRKVLEQASLYTNSILTRRSTPPVCGVPEEITLSILVLGATLFRAATRICLKGLEAHYTSILLGEEKGLERGEEVDEDEIARWSEPYWGFSNLSASRLKQQGWCIRDITMLQDLFSADSIHYITTLGITKTANHSQCTSFRCEGNYVDPKEYQTQHTENACQCALVEVDQAQVVSILADGGVPVVGCSLTAIHAGEPLHVERSSSVTLYVAISHVWSHGLGNVRTNAIRTCQVERLLGYFRVFDDHGDDPHPPQADRQRYFWLDTLCVPVSDNEARKTAIGRLSETYKDAQIVLVLDKELHSYPIPSTTEEITMRLSCSDWMRRLWTLQEGVLARELHVQFLNGVVDLAKEHKKEQDDEGNKVPTSNNIASDSRQLYSDIEMLNIAVEGSDFEVTKLIHISNALRYRSTSRPGDEAICIATFIGFYTDRVYDLPPDRRILYLLSHIPKVPRHIMFMAGTKLQDEGYRWAPASFLNRNTSTDTYALTAGASVPRTPDGLSVTFPGFTFKHGCDKLESIFYMVDRAERVWYKFESARHLYPECVDEPDWESCLAWLSAPAIVMPCMLSETDSGGEVVCALLSNAQRDGEVIRARFEARAFVSRMVQETIPSTELYTLLNDPDAAASGKMAVGERVSANQSWCIS